MILETIKVYWHPNIQESTYLSTTSNLQVSRTYAAFGIFLLVKRWEKIQNLMQDDGNHKILFLALSFSISSIRPQNWALVCIIV